MRPTGKALAQKFFWPQLIGTSNNSLNIMKAVGRAGIQRAMDLFGDDGLTRRMKMKNVQQFVKDSSRIADRQTNRLIMKPVVTIHDIDSHLRTHATHMSPRSAVDLMLFCGRRGISLGHDHIRAMNSCIKRAGSSALSAKEISQIFRGLSHLQSDVTEVRLLLVTLKGLLSNLPSESYNTSVFVSILNGMRNMSTDYAEVSDVVSFLAYKLDQLTNPAYPNHIQFSARDISQMMYGCKSFCSKEPAVAHLLQVYSHLILRCPHDFTAAQAAMCLHGLSSCQLEKAKSQQVGINEVRGVLVALEDAIHHSPLKWSSSELGMAFYGLQNMSSECLEVQSMYSVLLPRLEKCVDKFSPESVSSLYYGFKSSTAVSPVEGHILRAMRGKLQKAGSLPVNAIGVAMLGLKHSVDSHPMVLKNIKTLAMLLERQTPTSGGEPSAVLEGRLAANTLFSMQNQTADSKEVRKMLKRISDRVYYAAMDVETLTMSIYGLNKMSSRWSRVRSILLELSRKLEISVTSGRGVWRGGNIARALYGIRKMSSKDTEVLLFVNALAQCVESSVGIMSAEEMCYALYGMQGLSSEYKEVQRLVKALEGVLERSVDFIDTIPQVNDQNTSVEPIHDFTAEAHAVASLAMISKSGVSSTTISPYGKMAPNETPPEGDKRWKRMMVKAGGPVTAHSAALAIYGFRNMHHQHAGVPRLLFFVRNAFLDENPVLQPMNTRQITMALYGLQNMPTECRHGMHILRKLTYQVRHCSEEFSHHQISNCFFSLWCKSTCPLVLDLVHELTLKLKQVKGFEGHSISRLLQGLRRMDNGKHEVTQTTQSLRTM